MLLLARCLNRRAIAAAVLGLSLLISVLSLWRLQSLQSEDDILAFLPRSSPEVAGFFRINERFHATDVALIGIATEDVFTADFLQRLQRLNRRLSELPQSDTVFSLASVNDFTPDPELGGIVTAPLVDSLPANEQERTALRAKVLSRPAIVGNLVSPDGKAVLVYCYLIAGSDVREATARMQAITHEVFPNELAYWGGAPFISSYIYDTTKEDLAKLIPWAVFLIVMVMLLGFSDPLGTLLALGTTAMGVVWALAAMAWLDVPFNLVLSSMPVILCTVGTAYGVHIIARFRLLRRTMSPTEALQETLATTGSTVLAAGFTTAASMLSFATMDIQPMKTFGIFTAVGVLFTVGLSLVLLPALLALKPLSPMPPRVSQFGERLGSFMEHLVHRRGGVIVLAASLLIVSAMGVLRVDSRVDERAFFAAGSPPELSAQFMDDYFGGDRFVQIYAQGDFSQPQNLRMLQHLADRLEEIPNVRGVQHVGMAITELNAAMSGQRRLPETAAQAGVLFSFLRAEAFSKQLVDKTQQHALLHVKLARVGLDETEIALTRIEATVQELSTHHKKPWRDLAPGYVAYRLKRLMKKDVQYFFPDESLTALTQPVQILKSSSAQTKQLERFLRSEECAVDVVQMGEDVPFAMAESLLRLGPQADDDAMLAVGRSVLPKAPDAWLEDFVLSVVGPLEDLWRHEEAKARLQKLSLHHVLSGSLEMDSVLGVLWDLDETSMGHLEDALANLSPVDFEVSGLPIMHRGLSRSVVANQWRSMIFSLGLVVIILMLLFRSFVWGIVATLPTVCTLLLIYGGMGWLGIRLDIGTSMLASIITGIGVDYALHWVAAWRAAGCQNAGRFKRVGAQVGPAIWLSAVMIAAGFGVLTLGDAKPLQNVGGLVAVAMLLAAATACFVLPALLAGDVRVDKKPQLQRQTHGA